MEAPVKTDWLFLLVLDADNDLNAFLSADMNEVEAGLYRLPNDVSVKVVALWDGTGKNDSKLYEMGPDNDKNHLGNFTIDVSDTADWLTNGEVDMSNPDTVTNFLIWAKNRYPANKVVLQFSDHGAGPRSVRSTRAMLTDDTTGKTSLMLSKQVSQAFTAAFETDTSGYWNHIGLMLFDLCLGASIEDAFEVANFADYMVASPTNIPSYGLDYTKLLGGLKTDFTLSAFGRKIVTDYKIDYNRISNNSLTLVDLREVATLRGRVESVSEMLLNKGGAKLFPNANYSYKDGAGMLLVAQNMTYDGVFTVLHDIGTFMNTLYSYGSTWPELRTAIDEVRSALKKTIVYSWSNGNGGAQNFAGYDGANQLYGLTIVGKPSSPMGAQNYPLWYSTDLSYGANSNWYRLLDFWYANFWKK
jgi:hypothetical protein